MTFLRKGAHVASSYAAWQEIRYALSKNISRNGPRNCRSLGFAPDDTSGGFGNTPLKPKAKEGLNGAPSGFCCWCSEQCHSSLNLPQASWLLGMTKGSATLPSRAVAGLEVFFTTLGGPQAHDSSRSG
jgi:hypothetical protein